MSIVEGIIQAFSSYGPEGMLVALFVVVFFDAILVPVGPELLAIAIYATNLDVGWAVAIVITVAAGQVAGTTLLYLIGRHPRLLPAYMRNVMDKYRSSLFITDERMVLVNCFVPILPFLGAFVAVAKWDYRKSLLFVAIGGMLKYSFFLSMSNTFHYLFEKGIAQDVSLLTVLALLVASGVYAYTKRRQFDRSPPPVAGGAGQEPSERRSP